MQIVIDIPEDMYYAIEHRYWSVVNETVLLSCVANGIPIPKGHGRLMMLSEDKLKENQMDLDFSCQKWISEVGLSNATVVIIEADKAEREDEVGRG